MPTIPFLFNNEVYTMPHQYEDFDVEERPLNITDRSDGLVAAEWNPLGLSIVHSKSESGYPDLDDIARHNPSFTKFGAFGYTVGGFSEFFISSADSRVRTGIEINIGGAEASVGMVTPLGYYLFEAQRDDDYLGEWEYLHSIRLLGVSPEGVERFLLSVLIELKQRFDINISLIPVEPIEFDDEEEAPLTSIISLPPPCSDEEPMRLLWAGIQEDDPIFAFLQFYRVLEYYSIMDMGDAINRLRIDRNLSTKEFVSRISGLLIREERSAICRIISKIADRNDLALAKKHGFVQSSEASSLGNAIYDYRNSIVHAKYDQRSNFYVPSPFEIDQLGEIWKSICFSLAYKAMTILGGR